MLSKKAKNNQKQKNKSVNVIEKNRKKQAIKLKVCAKCAKFVLRDRRKNEEN